jgi:hypothetical protein
MVEVIEVEATVAAHRHHIIVGDAMSAPVLAHTLLVSIFFNQKENFYKPHVFEAFLLSDTLIDKHHLSYHAKT